MGNRFPKVLMTQGSEIKSVLSLGRREEAVGHLGTGRREPLCGLRLGGSSQKQAKFPQLNSSWVLASVPWAYLFLSHFSWVWKMPLGNLGRIPVSIVVALKKREKEECRDFRPDRVSQR